MGDGAQLDKIAGLEAEIQRLKAELNKSHLSERRFLDALRLSPMALCHHDRDLRYTWLYNGHMGFVQDEVIGKTDWDILGGELADRMGVIKRRVLETGIGERVEMPTVFGDENSEYFDLVVEPLKDEVTGEIIGLSCSGIDVTEDRRRREAYKASEENLKFIFNASLMPIVVTHQETGKALFYNKAAEDLFDLGMAPDTDFFQKLDLKDVLGQGLHHDTPLQDHMFEYCRGQGTKLYLTISATCIFYDGEAAVLSTFHDLTREAIYQQQLEKAKEQAELASQAKSQFLASASHDLRQPLHAMGLLLSVLSGHVTGEQGHKVLDHITTSLESMNELFAGILDISKLDANAVQLNIKPVCVQNVFDKLKADFTPLAQERGLGITFVDTSVFVKSDPLQIERILRNLISNAVRYTLDGRILVGCRRRGSNVEFCVLDTGIGIAAQDVPFIFQEFRQVDNPERDRRKGMGLGLAICERVANLLHTTVQVQSEKGRGSCFSFVQPMRDAEIAAPVVEAKRELKSLRGCHILFVEDALDVQTATKYLLESWGCTPIIVPTLEAAQTELRQSQIKPDAIIADYRLRDGENGAEVIQCLRDEFGQDIAAAIVSGNAAPELLNEMRAKGLDLLRKPIMSMSLYRKIQLLISP